MNERQWAPIEEVETMNVGLPLPENYYKAEMVDGYYNDLLWIADQLSKLTLSQRARAAEAYSEAYHGDECRRECNQRLRAFVERCQAVNMGKVSKPPMYKG